MTGLDLTQCFKSPKTKSFFALSVTVFFCFLHLFLWLCIAFRTGWRTPRIHHQTVAAHVVISELSTVGIVSDTLCILVSLITMYGVKKDYKGRFSLLIWVIFMIFYLVFESLVNCCFLYWSLENKQVKFVLISTLVFWLGRSIILTVCTIQVMSRFYELIRMKEEDRPPTITIKGFDGKLQTVPNPDYKPRNQRSASVATVCSTISEISNPDAYCEKQYPGFLPYTIDYENSFPYTFEEDLHNPNFLQYDYDAYPNYQPDNPDVVMASPSYEEATNGPNLCPPPYNTEEAAYEGDINLNLSAGVVDSTQQSGLLNN